MPSGWRTWTNGEVVTDTLMQNYLQEQVINYFANAAARDAAITSPEIGMWAFLGDVLQLTFYSGFSWDPIANGTGWQTYTPTWSSSGTQPGLGNGTINGRYARFGKTVHFDTSLIIGSTSTAGTGNYRISLPSLGNADTTIEREVLCRSYDASATTAYMGQGVVNATYIQLQSGAVAGSSAVANVSATAPWVPATGDIYKTWGTYELD